MKRINIYLSEQQVKFLKKLAQQTDIKVAEHIRRAIDQYLKDIKVS